MVKKVKLISIEGDAFQIPISCCHLSEVINCELECHSSEDEDASNDAQNGTDSCITLSLTASKIHSSALRKVADFMMHFEEEEMTSFSPPFTTENIGEIVQQWYADFITSGVDHSLLTDIIAAANFLSIQPLLKLSVLAMSININGKSPETLRPMFGISNNLNDSEQKARVMKENEWAFEARRKFEENQAKNDYTDS
mmetsp:Transcript_8333/g.12397  ORF Transcript_8333/g.12397 Transcript_8333/m.12397 type:complete len:197 (+) Transcript_8333:56-646(+)